MEKNYYQFVSWLEYNYSNQNNRDIINDFLKELNFLFVSNKIKLINSNFKNLFTAYLYEHSSYSKINKNINSIGSEQCNDIFRFKYEDIFINFFYKIKDKCKFYSFNILDSNDKYQLINFIDLIEKNIEILEEVNEEDEEEDIEDYDFDNY